MKRDFSRNRRVAALPPDKAGLRQVMLQRLRGLSPEARLEASLLICQAAARWPSFQKAETVALFHSLKTEPETGLLLEEAWARKKRVLLPRTWPLGRLTWHQVWDGADLEKREPKLPGPAVPVDEMDCLFVPGLAFDRNGYRLGRGGGYYDRLLAALPETVPCRGLMFAAQEVAEVPREAHDLPLRSVLTETGSTVFPRN